MQFLVLKRTFLCVEPFCERCLNAPMSIKTEFSHPDLTEDYHQTYQAQKTLRTSPMAVCKNPMKFNFPWHLTVQ